MLEHGGRLQAAARRYGIPAAQWLDLSTGINPCGWPVPPPPPEVWRRLPEEEDGLLDAARGYYGCDSLLAVAGSQAAIQALPTLRPPGRVGVIAPAYAEHAHAWAVAGHRVTALDGDGVEERLAGLEAVVVVNPNNPSGRRYPPETLLAWHERLAERGGWLVVDEAFMDATPEAGLAAAAPRPGLVLLRSLGKFFGLAGVRLGFVAAEPALLGRLAERLGPWAVAHPTRWVAARALADRPWQLRERGRLAAESRRLAGLLADCGLAPAGGTALFQYVPTARAEAVAERLAERGVLVRRFADPEALRFGLPEGEAGWRRLAAALEGVV